MVEISREGGAALGAFLLILLVAASFATLVIAVQVTRIRRALVPPPQAARECPHCLSPMRRDAGLCARCGQDSPPWTYHQGRWWWTDETGSRHWLDPQANAWIRYEEGGTEPS